MCGIAGWFGPGTACEPSLLVDALRHRGRDGEGIWRDPDAGAALVHTRLAVLDLSPAGAQPMGEAGDSVRANGASNHGSTGSTGSAGSTGSTGNDGSAGSERYWLVFNGEIYNFAELRSALEADGEKFTGHSDTEVLLRLLVREGKDALPGLAGMFAFAFHDRVTGRSLLARDPFGIKPLYYLERAGSLAFASEIRALRPLTGDERASPEAMRDLLLWGTVPEPATMLATVRELPAGCCLERDGEKMTVTRWHRLEFPPSGDEGATGASLPRTGTNVSRANNDRDPVAITRDALLESMQRHLVSDVPVGIFLSGGIDSPAVLALAREVLGTQADLRTFSIGFDDPAYDESGIARRSAAHFGARHTEWRMTEAEGKAEIKEYLEAMDQPTTDGFNTWCVSRLARREGIKVVLSGLGGDELFGGYGSFRQVPRFLRLHRVLGPLRPVAAAAFEGISPVGSRWRRLAAFLRGPGTPLAAFHVQRGIFTEDEARRLAGEITGRDPGAAEWTADELPAGTADMISYLEITRYMRNQLLRDSDVFSMAHCLELRVPFVDARLFSAIASIPSSIRLRPGKQLLLDAVPEIPAWVREQPKRGFRFPFAEWMQGEFGDVLEEADRRTSVALVTWYRRWALAAALMRS